MWFITVLLLIATCCLSDHLHAVPSRRRSSSFLIGPVSVVVVAAAASSPPPSASSSPSSSSSVASSIFARKVSNHNDYKSISSSSHNTCLSWLSKGLTNLGNTCYLNSQLECAYHIPKVRNLILQQGGGGVQDNASIVTLQQIFDEMKYSPSSRTTSSLRSFCQTLGINPWEQQDAQEFWKLLLPELGYEPLLALYRGTYDTFIRALDGSGRERIRKEIFMDLSIDVADYDHVMDSLRDMFTEGEVLKVQEGNGWRPDKESEEKVDAIKGNRLIVRGLPKILQLHLKRFRHDWETGRVSKMNDRFVFEEVLDLQSVLFIGGDGGVDDKEECLYDLQSVVVHVGEYGSGHYYAYVRPNVRTNEWYRFDDDRVTRVSFQDVIEDAFGGHVMKRNANHDTCKTKRWEKKKGREGKHSGFWNILWKRLVRVGGGEGNKTRSKRSGLLEYGWGGRMSSAYMLQYVKRSEISLLY